MNDLAYYFFLNAKQPIVSVVSSILLTQFKITVTFLFISKRAGFNIKLYKPLQRIKRKKKRKECKYLYYYIDSLKAFITIFTKTMLV